MAKDLSEIQGKNTTVSPKNQLKSLLENNKEAIANLLPQHMDPQRLLQLSISAYTKIPKLKDCAVIEVLGSIVHCASIGLEPNTPLGEAWILPFWNDKRRVMEPVVVHGYPGLLKLADNTEYFKSTHVDVVHAGDDFDYQFGTSEHLHHRPKYKSKQITDFYFIAATVRGGFQIEVKPKAFVDSIRDRAPSKNSPAWSNEMDYEQMGKKTVLKQGLKWVPKSPHLSRALALDNMGESGQSQSEIFSALVTGDDVIEGETIEEETTATTQKPTASKKKTKKKAAKKAPAEDEGGEAGSTEEPSAAPGGDDVLSFEDWSEYLEKAEGEDDLALVEDLIRNMKPAVQGLARDLLDKKKKKADEGGNSDFE